MVITIIITILIDNKNYFEASTIWQKYETDYFFETQIKKKKNKKKLFGHSIYQPWNKYRRI